MITRRKIIETGLKAGIALGTAGIIGQAGNVLAEFKENTRYIDLDERPNIDPWTQAEERRKQQAQQVQQKKGPWDMDNFVSNGGVVTNTSVGLMFASHDNSVGISWEDAKRYCEDYQKAGFTDWRLPTKEELQELKACRVLRYNNLFSISSTRGGCRRRRDLREVLWGCSASDDEAYAINLNDNWDIKTYNKSCACTVIPVRKI